MDNEANMKKVTMRQARVGDLMRQTISELILRRVKDPRVEGVTITEVEISADLKSANVYFCMYNTIKKNDARKGLESAEGFLRHELKKALRIRSIPTLYFKFDASLDYGNKIDTLLDELDKDDTPDN